MMNSDVHTTNVSIKNIHVYLMPITLLVYVHARIAEQIRDLDNERMFLHN